jgi:hypothetical protein
MTSTDEFEELFTGTYISEQEKNAYLILKFNFSQVNSDVDNVKESFQEHIDTCLSFFGEKYRPLLGESYFKMMETKKSPHGKLEFLLNYVGFKGLKVYILIDKYDNFTNTILTTAGQAHYFVLSGGVQSFSFGRIAKASALDSSKPSIEY